MGIFGPNQRELFLENRIVELESKLRESEESAEELIEELRSEPDLEREDRIQQVERMIGTSGEHYSDMAYSNYLGDKVGELYQKVDDKLQSQSPEAGKAWREYDKIDKDYYERIEAADEKDSPALNRERQVTVGQWIMRNPRLWAERVVMIEEAGWEYSTFSQISDTISFTRGGVPMRREEYRDCFNSTEEE